MADLLSAVPARVTATADGLSHEIQFDGGEFADRLREDQLAKIVVASGAFKFNSGGPCSETNSVFTGDVPAIPFINGVRNIFYECTSAGSFDITFVGL